MDPCDSIDSTFQTDISLSQDELSESFLNQWDEDMHLEGILKSDNMAKISEACGKMMDQKRNKALSTSNTGSEFLKSQLLKLNVQIKEKNLKIETLKSGHSRKIEEMEKQVESKVQENRMLQVQMNIQEQQNRNSREELESRLANILKIQSTLQVTSSQIRACMDSGDLLTEAQYQRLKNDERQCSQVSLIDYISMKVYEKEQDWVRQVDELKNRIQERNEEFKSLKSQMEQTSENLTDERCSRLELENKLDRCKNQYEEVKSQIIMGHFKLENFDKINKEREEYELQFSDLNKQVETLKLSYDRTSKERQEFHTELSSSKQNCLLLQQDKDYLYKQVTDLQMKLSNSEERLLLANQQLEKVKEAREELYEKYIISRDQYRNEFEDKLKRELEEMKMKTSSELDRLKENSRELFERENRSLRESRDMAIGEKERALASEKDASSRYESLILEMRQERLQFDTRLTNCQSELKVRAFESDRNHLLYQEAMRSLKESQLSYEKLNAKMEVLTKEYYSRELSWEKRLNELQFDLNDKTKKLEAYKSIERELDEVVLQSAEVENEAEAEQILFSYGYGANIPTSAKLRLKQSVHLARRVLQLERANTSLRRELDKEIDRKQALIEEVENTNKLLEDLSKPHGKVVQNLKERDLKINKLNHVSKVQMEHIRNLQEDKTELIRIKNQLSLDLERLLNQEQEMETMKQLVLNLSRNNNNIQEFNANTSQDNIKSETVNCIEFTNSSREEMVSNGISHKQKFDFKPLHNTDTHSIYEPQSRSIYEPQSRSINEPLSRSIYNESSLRSNYKQSPSAYGPSSYSNYEQVINQRKSNFETGLVVKNDLFENNNSFVKKKSDHYLEPNNDDDGDKNINSGNVTRAVYKNLQVYPPKNSNFFIKPKEKE